MRGVGVTQAVRVQGRISRDHPAVKLDDFARAAVTQPRSLVINEQGFHFGRDGANRQIFL